MSRGKLELKREKNREEGTVGMRARAREAHNRLVEQGVDIKQGMLV